MDYSSSRVDTSLDLNINPRRVQDAKKPVETNFIQLGSIKEERSSGDLVEELNRVSAENKKLTGMLSVMCENYNALRSQLVDYMSKNQETKEQSPSRKRKSESSNTNVINNNENTVGINGNSESSSTDDECCKKPREEIIKAKISRVYVKTAQSDTTFVVKDGYQWRKYGQKVTRDNPSPRAYFKCSFAPSCPVKRKVQRSMEDQSVVVATYEGEHNHPQPSQMEATSGPTRSLTQANGSATHGSTITLDLTKSKASTVSKPRAEPPAQVRQFLVEQMASSLTKDPNFTAALAAAISGRMLHRNM